MFKKEEYSSLEIRGKKNSEEESKHIMRWKKCPESLQQVALTFSRDRSNIMLTRRVKRLNWNVEEGRE